MANLTITNVDTNGGIQERGRYQDILFTAAGAATYAENTILAVDSISKKAVVFAIGGSTNENGIPRGLLTEEITTTGAGDTPIRMMVGGVVEKDALVVDADGDASNVDQLVKDDMRDTALITVVETTNLSVQDNQ
jgi:hypothetical protein